MLFEILSTLCSFIKAQILDVETIEEETDIREGKGRRCCLI